MPSPELLSAFPSILDNSIFLQYSHWHFVQPLANGEHRKHIFCLFSLLSFGYYKLAFCLHFSPLYFLVVFFLVQLCSWLQFFIFFFPHNNSQVFFQRMVLDGYLIQHIQYFLHHFVDCRQITWGVLIFKYIYHLQAQIISKDPKTNSIALFLAFSSASSVSIIFHSKYLFSGDLCQIICTC